MTTDKIKMMGKVGKQEDRRFVILISSFVIVTFALFRSAFRPYNAATVVLVDTRHKGGAVMRCPACGVEVVEQAVYCHKCGERILPAGDEVPGDFRPVNASASESTNAFNRAASVSRDSSNPPEDELWRGGFSSKAMLGAWVISGLISLALLVGGVFWARTGTWWLILLTLMILPWLYYFSILCYRRMGVHYLLTTQRFIHESGILKRVNDRVEVLDMDDITFEQGLLERVVGVGTIRIASHDRTDPELVLRGIENVKQVASLFDNARIAERRRRGLHVEQI
jgi:hypothetical protein